MIDNKLGLLLARWMQSQTYRREVMHQNVVSNKIGDLDMTNLESETITALKELGLMDVNGRWTL